LNETVTADWIELNLPEVLAVRDERAA
ncbi:hypothetical protein MZH14_25750, partial [Escherichia coli]|nr:hypothetical protein [Escherichia coli]MCK3604184.1 hypothetical protein [Escherichia coli]